MARSPELTRHVLSATQWRTLDHLFKRWVIELRPRCGTRVLPSKWARVQPLRALVREGTARRRRDHSYTITPHGRRVVILGPPDGVALKPGRYVWENPGLWEKA